MHLNFKQVDGAMKSLILSILCVASFSAVAGHCNYPDDIASDGSVCGGRAASVRAGGYTPPPEYSTPVYVNTQDTEIKQREAQAAEVSKWDQQTLALNDPDEAYINTGLKKWLCPVTAMEGVYKYRTVESDTLSEGVNFIVVSGHKWKRKIDKNNVVYFSNPVYSDFDFFFMKDKSGVGLGDTGNTGNAEVQHGDCVSFKKGLSAKFIAENPIDEIILNTWRSGK